MMFKIFAFLVYISLTVDKSTAALPSALPLQLTPPQYDSTTRIALNLNARFRIYGDVVGNERVLFGESITFRQGQCCNDTIAFAGHLAKIDLVIALDESGSVGSQNFEIMKKFVEDITSRFVVSYSATRVAVITWSTRVTLEFDFNEYINNEGVKKGIRSIRYNGGWTATGDALNFIRKKLFSQSPSDAMKVLFVLTDGKSNKQSYSPISESTLLKHNGVEVFAFGIGGNVNDNELVAIASQPTTTHKFRVETFKDLSSLSHLISSSGCTDNTMYDACARKCTCSRGILTNCKRVRKNFLDMTELERCRYLRAVKTASTVEPFKSEYDQLIGIHEQLFNNRGIHNGSYFLPWHRWYIIAYENILRKVDCRVTVPYWDWSLDSANTFTSDVWNSDLCKYTGLGGNGDPFCVATGPFAYPGWPLTPSAQNGCLRRYFNGGAPDCTAVQDELDANINEFDDFLVGLEVMLHNNVHGRIGGTMSYGGSSNAPEFFFHHGFIDKIWGDWQEKGIRFRQHEYSSNTTSMPGTTFSPRDVHDLDDQPYCVKVYYQEPKQDCIINGRTISVEDVAKMSVQERLRLSPNPIPAIPQQALINFGVPKSVMKRLPQISLRLFGVSVQISETPVTPLLKASSMPQGPKTHARQ